MISVIIPFHNEKENLKLLQQKLVGVLEKTGGPYELLFVDDGSSDGSAASLNLNSKSAKLIQHKKQLGKGKALTSGFQASRGDMIVFMDADLQDDPEDIPLFLGKLKEGHDFVNGWRKNREDPLSKTIPSAIFNIFLLQWLLRSRYHDINCGFKAMHRAVLEKIPLYGDNYRFLPIMAEQEGFRTDEVVVRHHKRAHGVSKYGFFRIISGFFDTVTTYFIYRFSEKPMHFFGPVGLLVFLTGFILCLYLAVQRLFYGILLFRRPALLLGVLLVIVGIQIVMTGIIGELIVYLNNKPKSK